MDNRKYLEKQKTITGYEEQELLIDMLADTIEKIAQKSEGSMRLYVRQGLDDALQKRNKTFKDMKFTPIEERNNFVYDIVINTVKRTKLVASVDEIVNSCTKVYSEWKKIYRPNDIYQR